MRKISTRLSISFLIVALLPAVPLSLVVGNLLERRFGPTITEPLETALEAGLQESRDRLHEQKAMLARRADDWSAALAGDAALSRRLIWSAGEEATASPALLLFSATGEPEARATVAERLGGDVDLLRRAATLPADAAGGPAAVVRHGDWLLVRAPQDPAGRGGALVVVQPLPAGMVERAGDLTDGLTLLRLVRRDSDKVVRSFVAPFLIIYGVLLVVAVTAGYLWSRRMVRPLEALVAGTSRVGGGDLETRVSEDAPGEVGDLIGAFNDMVGRLAEQRRDLARLERAAAWRGMARTLAHEVKNPLTPILVAVQEIRDRYPGDDPRYQALVDECTDIVREEVESLRRLVREFGDFARLPKPELSRGDLVPVVTDLVGLYGEERVAVTVETDALTGWFDGAALRRVLINLIDNGLAACREAGRAERVHLVVARQGDGGALIRVTDAGVGIPVEHRDDIFKPDFTTKSEGMGLGLAIADSVVAGHGGHIDLASQPGEGSAFTLYLPLTNPGHEDVDQNGGCRT